MMALAVSVSPIEDTGRDAVIRFARAAPWHYEHFELTKGEALAQPGYLARDPAGRLIGVMGCRLDRAPIASIVYAAIGHVSWPSQIVAALLEPSEVALRAAGAEEITFIGHAPWLARALSQAGFVTRTSVISYQRWEDAIPSAGNQDVLLRPAQPADAETIAEIDASAFEPMWRYPATTHRALIGRLPYVILGELRGQAIGYVASDVLYGQGQIIRLVVHPAWQHHGVGTRLLVEALRYFRSRAVDSAMLNTQTENAASRRLYERLGFERVGEAVPVLTKDLVP
jgi:ribosomal protein S18 acetylase RimI-like enzyme